MQRILITICFYGFDFEWAQCLHISCPKNWNVSCCHWKFHSNFIWTAIRHKKKFYGSFSGAWLAFWQFWKKKIGKTLNVSLGARMWLHFQSLIRTVISRQCRHARTPYGSTEMWIVKVHSEITRSYVRAWSGSSLLTHHLLFIFVNMLLKWRQNDRKYWLINYIALALAIVSDEKK